MLPARLLAPTLPLVLLVSACLPVERTENPELAGQTLGLTLLHTADIHSRLLPYDFNPNKTDTDLLLYPETPPYGGVARLASLIRRERARSDRVVQLDTGDYFQGGPIFNATDGEPEVRWMSMMNYDAVAMGNHEFDKGVQNFADKIERFGGFPLLAANYLWENPDAPNAHGLAKRSQPYTIVNARGLRIGVIGMGSISSMYGLLDGGNSMQAVPLEQNETVRTYVELLAPQVDFILVLSHLGLTEDQDLISGYDAYYPYSSAKPFLERKQFPWVLLEPSDPAEIAALADDPGRQVRVFIPGVVGVDVILGGHLHVVLNPPQVLHDSAGRNVVLSHSGAFSKYLGRLDLQVKMPPSRPQGVADDSPQMQAWLERKAWGAEVVAHEYRPLPVDAIWCDDEARGWRTQFQVNEDFRKAVNLRPTRAVTGSCAPEIPEDVLETKVDRTFTECDCAIHDAFASQLPADRFKVCFWQNFYAPRHHTTDPEGKQPDPQPEIRDFDCDRFIPEQCLSRVERCTMQEDRRTAELISPYIMKLDQVFALTRVFAFAPSEIARRNSSSGGDAPLGNMCAESMRVRRRVEAEFALTNTLGMRDNLYAGPVTLESMFNVFPFENTINVMYLSGDEVQELTDYVAYRSADRGCQAQGQVAGIRFVMDCAQVELNRKAFPCETAEDCQVHGTPQHPEGWKCTDSKVCWAHDSYGVEINGQPVQRPNTYKVAVNDYIAKGGSGFKVLKRNTTRIETNVSLRDSLIDWMRGQCTCEDILGESAWTQDREDWQKVSSAGYPCAVNFDNGQRVIDQVALNWCNSARDFRDLAAYHQQNGSWPEGTTVPELFAGKCSCKQVLDGDELACGHISRDLVGMCSAPTRIPIAVGAEDGRIGRRVQ